MKLLFVSLALLVRNVDIIYSLNVPFFSTVDSDAFLNATGLIASKGYPVEDHTVTTKDGYLLQMQRIPHGKDNSGGSDKRPPVFVLHGLFEASSMFAWNFPNESLAFILADNGYDVWLGNDRGNTYGRKHVSLSPSENAFWNFTFDQKASLDLPAMIDYILSKTGEKKLSFIAHSGGTTNGFALLSMSPEYNEKIKVFIAMSPLVYVENLGGLFRGLIPILYAIQPFTPLIQTEFLANNALFKQFGLTVCGSPAQFICAEILFGLFGRDPKELNYTRLPVYFTNYPAGSSTKEGVHFSQMVYSGKFRMYDYYSKNQAEYNQDSPPEYDVSKITTPIALMSGINDIVADQKDIDKLRPQLKSTILDYVVPYDQFNHIDFLVAINSYPLFIKKILSVLQSYNN